MVTFFVYSFNICFNVSVLGRNKYVQNCNHNAMVTSQ
jgi:hypothetical protein